MPSTSCSPPCCTRIAPQQTTGNPRAGHCGTPPSASRMFATLNTTCTLPSFTQRQGRRGPARLTRVRRRAIMAGAVLGTQRRCCPDQQNDGRDANRHGQRMTPRNRLVCVCVCVRRRGIPRRNCNRDSVRRRAPPAVTRGGGSVYGPCTYPAATAANGSELYCTGMAADDARRHSTNGTGSTKPDGDASAAAARVVAHVQTR